MVTLLGPTAPWHPVTPSSFARPFTPKQILYRMPLSARFVYRFFPCLALFSYRFSEMFHKCVSWFLQVASKPFGIRENGAYFHVSHQAWHRTLHTGGTRHIFTFPLQEWLDYVQFWPWLEKFKKQSFAVRQAGVETAPLTVANCVTLRKLAWAFNDHLLQWL